MLKSDRRMFIAVELFLGCAALIMAVLMLSGRSAAPRITVVISNSDEGRWSLFTYGIKQAAADKNIDVIITNTEDIPDAAAEKTLLEREIADGAEALIVEPAADAATAAMLEEVAKKVPVLLVGSGIESSDLPVVEPDQYQIGKALADMIDADYGGNISGKRLGILNGSPELERAAECERGFRETLEGRGCDFVWSIHDLTESEDPSDAIHSAESVDLIIALNNETLELAGTCQEEKKMHGALIYGVGTSMKAIYYLDHGNARGLIVPNGFEMGYQAVVKAAAKLQRRSDPMMSSTTSFKAMHRNELFMEENEQLLFSQNQ